MKITSVVEPWRHGLIAIIGAHLPIALRPHWGGAKYKGTRIVAVCFFGDGHHQYSALHEALN